MWFLYILSALRIVYEIVQCIVCLVKSAPVKKGTLPPGWKREPEGPVCPRCS